MFPCPAIFTVSTGQNAVFPSSKFTLRECLCVSVQFRHNPQSYCRSAVARKTTELDIIRVLETRRFLTI